MYLVLGGAGKLFRLVSWVEGATQFLRRAWMLTEVVLFFFLPVWCFLAVDTFTFPGDPFNDFFMSVLGRRILALAQVIFALVLFGFFIGELETRREMRRLKGN